MDLRYPPEAEAFRATLRAFLADHLPPGWRGIGALGQEEAEDFVERWRGVLHRNELLGVTWPKEYGGGGLTKLEQVVLAEEFATAGVPTMAPNDTFSIKMVGNTLIRLGTEEQKRRFLPRILSGEDRWCQGYSEPEAGSDLAGLRTRAVRDGDEWVVTGQKIWTSRARQANWIFVLARSDPAAAKHRGITFLLVPMQQRGVDVRPITMLSGASDFNEVFLDGARTSGANVVGEVNGGWAVAQILLGYERGEEAATNPVLFRAELDRLVEMARARGCLGDPVVRQRITDCYVKVETMRFLGYRILTGVLSSGRPGPESSISKLYWSEYHQQVTRLALDILGPDALVPSGRGPLRSFRTDDPGAPNSTASWVGAFYNATADTIYAGTSEVQRNILAERVLGLPRDLTPAPKTEG